VNHKRVARLWRREGLKVPKKQPQRGRLWFNDGSCIRRRPEYPNHVWSYDFVQDRTADGRAFRVLAIIDEYTRECLSLDVARSLRSGNVLDRLESLFVQRGGCHGLRAPTVFTRGAIVRLRRAASEFAATQSCCYKGSWLLELVPHSRGVAQSRAECGD
jgi:transposase InsO family protein